MANGYIKSWRRDRGFGFIKVDDRDSDVFVHISELRDLGRPPRVGDEINFDIETQENGKVRAINCKMKGANSNPSTTGQGNGSVSGNNSVVITIIVLLVVAAGLYFFLK